MSKEKEKGLDHDMTPFLRWNVRGSNSLVTTVFSFPVNVIVSITVCVIDPLLGLRAFGEGARNIVAGARARMVVLVTMCERDNTFVLPVTEGVWAITSPVGMIVLATIKASFGMRTGPPSVFGVAFTTEGANAGEIGGRADDSEIISTVVTVVKLWEGKKVTGIVIPFLQGFWNGCGKSAVDVKMKGSFVNKIGMETSAGLSTFKATLDWSDHVTPNKLVVVELTLALLELFFFDEEGAMVTDVSCDTL
jgi:hypothetical protein